MDRNAPVVDITNNAYEENLVVNNVLSATKCGVNY